MGLKGYWQLSRGTWRRMDATHVSLVAAGSAFFAMLSLFPGLAAIVSLLGLVADPEIVDAQLPLLEEFMPAQAYDIVAGQVTRLVSTGRSALGWATAVTLGTALWSSRLGTDAVIRAITAVHGTPVRGGIKANLVALALTLGLIIVAVVALLTMVVLPLVLAFLPLGPYEGGALEILRWVVALVVVMSGIWLLYRFAPAGPSARVRWASPGALMAIAVWAFISWAFSHYLVELAGYNQVYGSLGAVIALLMFLYLTIYVVLGGAALNAELHDRRVAEPAGQAAGEPEALAQAG